MSSNAALIVAYAISSVIGWLGVSLFAFHATPMSAVHLDVASRAALFGGEQDSVCVR